MKNERAASDLYVLSTDKIRQYDIVMSSTGEEAMVISRSSLDVDIDALVIYPFKTSKFRIVNWFNIKILKLKVYLKIIK